MSSADPAGAAASAAASAPVLRVRALSVTHEGADAATPSAVTFDVAPGEVVLLLGPSGSGKSTLALTLNGLIPHAIVADVEGTVQVAGLTASDTPVATLSTHVGMVFQDPDAQLVTGTILDEVAFGLENLRVPADEIMRRAETALRRVGLWERRAENPDRLSGGGRQRLAIACALAMGSSLLVLDEPTANLDPTGIEDVYAALADIRGEQAVILIEHNLDVAVGHVDRVVVLDGAGRLVMDGPVDLLRDRAVELLELGVWLPTATLAALRLRAAGYPLAPLPLTAAELRASLDATPAPAVAARATAAGEVRRPTPADPLIRVRGLTVRRGRKTILHDIALDVRRGDFLAVVGANGAGKTTLVQAIAGVVPPPRGRIRVGPGLDPGRASADELARHIGFVFQNPEHQFIAHTVYDELAHGLRDVPDARPRVEEMLARFGLTGKEDVHPFLLSGGQKRRLSVGTALIAGAPILALDEPTFGQDRERADELLGILDDLHRTGATVIVVTHDMQLVAEHATHMAVLAEGRLIAHGTTDDVFADRAVIDAAGLRLPPLAEAFAGIRSHPELDGVVRLHDLPEATA